MQFDVEIRVLEPGGERWAADTYHAEVEDARKVVTGRRRVGSVTQRD